MPHDTIENKNAEKDPAEGSHFAHLDPRDLDIEPNVRRTVDLDPDFVESIKEYGVLVPVLVQRTDDGRMQVRAGQKRTLGAIKAEQATIPAYIVHGVGGEAERVILQLIENDQRTALTDADRAHAFEQLSLMGMSAAAIARKTKAKKKTVETALQVSRSQTATEALGTYDLDLEQAAVIAEFQDDEKAVARLTDQAIKNPAQFNHLAQQLRTARETERQKAAVRETLRSAGVKEIDRPGWEQKEVTALSSLTDREGTTLTAGSHAGCPGHAAYLTWSGNGEQIVPQYVCTDPKSNKHKRVRTSHSGKPRTPQEADQERAERARVREGNTAWRSAQVVRREWLVDFAKRRTAPKDAAAFLAATFLQDTRSMDKADTKGYPLAAEWLGVGTKYGSLDRGRLREMINRATPARALQITLVLALAGIEQRLDVHTWQNAGSERRYLSVLEEWGYTLAPIEETARGPKPTPATQKPAPTAPQARTGKPAVAKAAPTSKPISKPKRPTTSTRPAGRGKAATGHGSVPSKPVA